MTTENQRIRCWWHPGMDGAVTLTRFVVYWRGASPLWGFHRDARGLTLRLGRLTIYPKGC